MLIPNNSPTLSNDGQSRRRLIRLAVMLVILIGVMIALADLATRLQERLGFDYVAQQVELLGSDPVKAQQFVNEQIRLDDYQGSLRGPVATLWAGAGSELDRAHLLMTMLRLCGEQAQLARSGETWWVDSPAVVPPARVTEAEWRGSLIPSAASHRLEIEIRTGGMDDPLRVELNLAELSDDPLLLEMESGTLHLRRISQRQPLASCALPDSCNEVEVLCRTLLPDDSVEFESSGIISLYREARAALPSMDAGQSPQPILCGVLVVLTATPPLSDTIPVDQMSGHLFPLAVSFAYKAAVGIRRSAQNDEAPSAELPFNSKYLIPRYFLATILPVDSTTKDYTEVELVVLYNPPLPGLPLDED